MKLLVTGGAGFIGSNFIRYWLNKYPSDSITNFDLLTYAGNLQNLTDVHEKYRDRYSFSQGDIADFQAVEKVFIDFKPDILINFAAESHNSGAIIDPGKFFRTNVLGTQTLLEVSRKKGLMRFQHISTCEVYGDLPLDSEEIFSEESALRPRTPYNASKAAADHAVQAYFHTFNLPAIISRCSNNFGPYQFPEKLIPLFITRALNGQSLPLYQHSQNKREWTYVIDHCQAIDLMIHDGKIGEIYNVGSGIEKSVEEIADFVLSVLNLDKDIKTYVPDRPGHDRRYLLNSSKICDQLNWAPVTSFEAGLTEVINWYINNESWWKPLKERLNIQEDSWPKQKM
jgi:dTDP-glucose 4,6-dehydratase